MALRKHLENLNKDLSCSICLDFFQDPVSLDCGHVFCKACILIFWEDGNCSCPECRLFFPGKVLRPNRPMANIVTTVQSLLETSTERENSEGLNLFSGTSQNIIDPSLQLTANSRHIKRRVQQLTNRFDAEFADLHQILNQEEKELKRRFNQREQEILHRLGSGTRATTEMNPSFKQVMWNFLKEIKTILSGSDDEIRQESKVPVNMLIGEFGGPLQYMVWRQMRKSIKPALTHLTLYPNSAHPSLILSESMTRMRVGYVKQHLPDNPKRFQHCICVLGSKGFTSGKHYWEVEVDQGAKWMVGVVKESVNRKEFRALSTQNGYWVISPYTTNWMQWLLEFFVQKERNLKQVDHLTLQVNPKKVGIYLDYEGGQVSFYDAGNMSHLHTHCGRMTGKLFSVFSPGNASNNQMKLLQMSS
ncbi:zinc-binding protein A33-like [Heterodontus francisci]|uniref:zinc-binding protein A33-like n=1 Tax=Heterodontus francisci TaxID=7792 RepID=UPI00355B4B85